MFGMTPEKLIIIGVAVALIAGPQRLPEYAERLAGFVRSFRSFVEATRVRGEADLGIPLDTAAWRDRLDAVDPRRVVQDVLSEPPAIAPVSDEPPGAGSDPEPPAVRQRWVVTGGSGHPRRVLVTEEVDPPAGAGETDRVGTDESSEAERVA